MASILQPYRGRFYSADSAATRIDLDAILAGCSAVESEAGAISNISKSVSEAASSLTPDVFSIDGYTVSSSVDECCSGIVEVQLWIVNTVSQIRDAAINAYNQIQNQLNNEAQARDINEINRVNAMNSRR